MTATIAVLRLLAASQVLLFGCALGISKNPWHVRILGVLLALAVIAYLIIPLTLPYGGLVPVALIVAADTIPFLLLWFTWEVFEDERHLPWPLLLLGGLYLAASMTDEALTNTAATLVLPITLQILKLLFACGSLAIVWRGRETDLVEDRLRLRRLFAAGIAVMIAAVVIVELVTAWRVPQILEILGMLSIFVLGLAINLAFLRLNPAFALTRAVATPEGPATDDPLLGELTRLMTEERLYADHDLRIGALAARLKMPEYRLRRVINQQLGYQNFNQFINGYRIEEAARRLRSEPRNPVLTIALDVGFRSMSSFNVAFRTRYGRSPSQFRTEALTET